MATDEVSRVARIAAVVGMPYGLLLVPVDAFVAFALAFNGHPATIASAVYFLVATVVTIVDIVFSISLLRRKRGPRAIVVTSGIQLAATVAYIGASLLIGAIEDGQWMQWVALAPLAIRFAALALARR